MKLASTDSPEEAFLVAAIELHDARGRYDHKRGNVAFDRLINAARQIRLGHGDGGEMYFTSLLAHEMVHVVSKAAFFLIPLNPRLARKIYEDLAKGQPGEARFNAEMTLKEWDAGRLEPDWFMKEPEA